MPKVIAPELLVDRYIPNLVAEPFSLSRAFVERVATESGSDVLAAVLSAWETQDPVRLARTLLIELLAYQFASPVRWIQTQDVLFEREPVDVFVEVGVKEQPTIANMALITLSDGTFERRPRVLNSEGLRYENEFVKHKVLDAIGDLYLLGHPLIGEYAAFKSGHGLNNELARALLARADAFEVVSFEGRSQPPLAFQDWQLKPA